MIKKSGFTILFSILCLLTFAQTGEIRGFVYDKETGEPIIFNNVIIKELMLGKTTDANGFYTISKVKPGAYTLLCFSLGYDTSYAKISV